MIDMRHHPLLFLICIVSACGVFKPNTAQCRGGPGLAAQALTGNSLAGRVLALSFDGGPSQLSAQIGDFLYGNGVRAAFFVRGREIAAEAAQLERLKARGHLIGQQGYSGDILTGVPEPVLELRKTDQLITPYVTGNMFLLRPPAGIFDDDLAAQFNRAGLNKYVGPIGWDLGASSAGFVDDRDCLNQGLAPATCAQIYLERLRMLEHGIVRFASERPAVLEIVQILITKLRDEGFEFVRIDEVPAIRLAIERAGGKPGTIAGPGGCNEY